MNLTSRTIQQWLQDWHSAGITHLPPLGEIPPAKSAVAQVAPILPPAPLVAPTAEKRELSITPEVVSKSKVFAAEPPLVDETIRRVRALEVLNARVCECQKCPLLAQSRTQTVFGVGSPNARVLFLGEAPGEEEDRQGEPFVGAAGQLLNKIIAACGFRREDLYICNILRCRPPGNRTPEAVEAQNCREFLDGQISIIDPDYIVCWGGCAATNLLGVVSPVGRLRGRFHQHGRAKVLVTYHPSYLLRDPSQKKAAWEDMKFMLKDMGLEPPVA